MSSGPREFLFRLRFLMWARNLEEKDLNRAQNGCNQYAELTTKTTKILRLAYLNSCRENTRLVPHEINCYSIYGLQPIPRV